MQGHELIVDLAVRYGFQILGAIVILAAGALVSRWIGALVSAQLARRQMEPPMQQLVVRVVRVIVMLFALVVALDKLGFQVAPLVAGIGVAGLGLGIALQGVLSNVVAGMNIIFTKPFASTTLVHADRSRVIIPNRKIVGEILHNFGGSRQLSLALAVAQPGDLTALLRGVRDVVMSNPRVLKDPPPAIGIAQLTDAGVKVAVQPWVKVPDVGTADGELYQALAEHLRARGVRVTPPLRHEVHVLNGKN